MFRECTEIPRLTCTATKLLQKYCSFVKKNNSVAFEGVSVAVIRRQHQTVEITGFEYSAAEVAVTKGPLRILAGVHRQHGHE